MQTNGISFESLGLAQPLLAALRDQGYSTPTPIQLKAIGPILEGRDLVGCAQTGTGKTAAFALPILQRLGGNPVPEGQKRFIRALVLSPTRELAAQIGQSFRDYGQHYRVRQGVIFGGVNDKPQIHALRAGVDLLIACPGRLIDLMDRGHVDLSRVEVFVLDEADQLLDMGFIPAIRRVVARLPKQRQNLLFSATMPKEIRELAASILREPVNVAVDPVSSAAQRVEQYVYHVEKAAKPHLLAHVIRHHGITRGLVFTRTKHGADRVARHLTRAGICAQAIHGNKSQGQRERTIKAFKGASPPILVATDIAARGLDIDAVSHVLNYDLPNVPETYVHRIGRTGRAGASGIAISFCGSDERDYLRDIERLTRKTIAVRQDKPAGLGTMTTTAAATATATATTTAPPPQPARSAAPARPAHPRPLAAAARPAVRPAPAPHARRPDARAPQQRPVARPRWDTDRGPLPAPDAMPEHGYRPAHPRQGGKRPHRKGQPRPYAHHPVRGGR